MKPLVIVLAAAAFLAAGSMAIADTYYTLSNPRILHVPRPGDDPRRSQASLHRDTPDDLDDEDVAPAPRALRTQPKAVTHKEPKTVTRERAKAVMPREPKRRKPFNVALPEPPPPEPEPAGPKRALLSAPPPLASIHDGPTPLRPTPRFGQPVPEAPAPLTTFTPPALNVSPKAAPSQPPATDSVAAVTPAPEPAAPAPASPPAPDDSDDHLPPPGDPRLAPPEPRD